MPNSCLVCGFIHRWWFWLTSNSKGCNFEVFLRTQATRAGTYEKRDLKGGEEHLGTSREIFRVLRVQLMLPSIQTCVVWIQRKAMHLGTLSMRLQLGTDIIWHNHSTRNHFLSSVRHRECGSSLHQSCSAKTRVQIKSPFWALPLLFQDQMKSINKLCMERRSVRVVGIFRASLVSLSMGIPQYPYNSMVFSSVSPSFPLGIWQTGGTPCLGDCLPILILGLRTRVRKKWPVTRGVRFLTPCSPLIRFGWWVKYIFE